MPSNGVIKRPFEDRPMGDPLDRPRRPGFACTRAIATVGARVADPIRADQG